MANAEKGEIAVNVVGRDLILCYKNNAVAELEQISATVFIALVAKLSEGSVAHARLMLWGALRSFHPELSLLDVGELLDDFSEDDFAKVMEALGNAARFRLSRLGYKLDTDTSAAATATD